ncbi:hypothetical protein AGLY_003861 [Aphis glycines]|uniref:Transmembrane protein n=1 Tax=Aphis glycines TaxID=307491 RepID=A0A6G0U1R5_APHGL|nr:hypothetical protein AGLY_003861 [Aphis glycines]
MQYLSDLHVKLFTFFLIKNSSDVSPPNHDCQKNRNLIINQYNKIFILSIEIFGGYFIYMHCLRLTNVQHSKNRFTQARTIQAVIEVEQPNVHFRKKRILIVQHCFLFFGYQNYKKSYYSKNSKSQNKLNEPVENNLVENYIILIWSRRLTTTLYVQMYKLFDLYFSSSITFLDILFFLEFPASFDFQG